MNEMQPMSTAPRDRGILLQVGNWVSTPDSELEPYERFVVAKYAEWDDSYARDISYKQVWEVNPGECFTFNDAHLQGWYELPKNA